MTENEAKACAMLVQASYTIGYVASKADDRVLASLVSALDRIKQAIEQLGKPAEPPPYTISGANVGPPNGITGTQWGGQQP